MGILDTATVKAELDAFALECNGSLNTFDESWYAQQARNIAKPLSDSGLSPLEHYVLYGADAGLSPNAWFDPAWYRATYADVASLSGADLLVHYLKTGIEEGRLPNAGLADLDGQRYLADNPDVMLYIEANKSEFGADETGGVISDGVARNGALAHWLKYGMAEQRPAYDSAGVLVMLPSSGSAEIGVTTNDSLVTIDPGFSDGHIQLIKTADVADATGVWGLGLNSIFFKRERSRRSRGELVRE